MTAVDVFAASGPSGGEPSSGDLVVRPKVDSSVMRERGLIVQAEGSGRRALGDVTVSQNPVSSMVEEQVRDLISGAGYAVPEQKVSVWCRHPDKPIFFLPLTPDVALIEHRIAIEIDPCGAATSHHGSSHRGKEDQDRLRNTLMGEVGWTVLRLRLCAEEGAHIGDRDVVCQSSGVTKGVSEALLAALEDAVRSQPPQVRFVPKVRVAPASRPRARRSSVVRLGEYQYGEDAHIFTWYPDLNSDEKVHLQLAMNGRFLYTHDKPPLFIAEVGLHEEPEAGWRKKLERILATLPPLGGENAKYPWGNQLLVGERDDQIGDLVVEACERRSTIDRATVEFTVSGHDIEAWTATELLAAESAVTVRIHEAAVSLGYRFVHVKQMSGRHGPYLKITLSRATEQAVP